MAKPSPSRQSQDQGAHLSPLSRDTAPATPSLPAPLKPSLLQPQKQSARVPHGRVSVRLPLSLSLQDTLSALPTLRAGAPGHWRPPLPSADWSLGRQRLPEEGRRGGQVDRGDGWSPPAGSPRAARLQGYGQLPGRDCYCRRPGQAANLEGPSALRRDFECLQAAYSRRCAALARPLPGLRLPRSGSARNLLLKRGSRSALGAPVRCAGPAALRPRPGRGAGTLPRARCAESVGRARGTRDRRPPSSLAAPRGTLQADVPRRGAVLAGPRPRPRPLAPALAPAGPRLLEEPPSRRADAGGAGPRGGARGGLGRHPRAMGAPAARRGGSAGGSGASGRRAGEASSSRAAASDHPRSLSWGKRSLAKGGGHPGLPKSSTPRGEGARPGRRPAGPGAEGFPSLRGPGGGQGLRPAGPGARTGAPGLRGGFSPACVWPGRPGRGPGLRGRVSQPARPGAAGGGPGLRGGLCPAGLGARMGAPA